MNKSVTLFEDKRSGWVKKKSSQTLLGSDTLKTNGQRKVEIKEMVKRHNKQNSNRKNAVTPIIISDKIWKC